MTDHDAIQDIHRRMDTQDNILREIRDMVIAHITTEAKTAQATEELVTLYKGSKLLIPMLAAAAVAVWSIFVWAKDHIK